ncbi:SGNH/GDSL hydrolase family protein [Brevundimonas sp.]|uniref:SGNH/GDSL hydrolase family protein n=1 Tax=Brevundimonas sp. TaxID=1871086 RepID=UPI002D50D2B3|nr:SGNH/GDSL hydrolase family protein [Brevundimonas sp.]HYC96863.1 SGNH/GDSL hydrolase family protein [Brevundimonas sp.]
MPANKLALVAALFALATAWPASAAHKQEWVAAWSMSPDRPGPALEPSTIRQVVRTTVGGSAVRVRLSNLLGVGAQQIGPVRVQVGEGMPLTVAFGGQPIVTIPQGADVLSDPVPLAVQPLQDITVRLYLPTGSAAATLHGVGLQTAVIARGDMTLSTDPLAGEQRRSRFFVTDIEVAADPAARALVIVGDSIADGVGSTLDANVRWPDVLAERLQHHPELGPIAVINAGMAGNRILNDGSAPYIGPSVMSRFERDALAKPGVRWILLAAGINDITGSVDLTDAKEQVSVEQIIEGMRTLAERARARDVKIWAATLLPSNHIEDPAQAAVVEAMRLQVNVWIRTSGAFDAVLDFEEVLRAGDAGVVRLNSEYDSGDHLHPNDKGYRALAESIDLNLFREAQ